MKVNEKVLVRSVATAFLIRLFLLTEIANANPVNAPFFDDPRCDKIANQTLKEELGGLHALLPPPLPPNPFPLNERIVWNAVVTTQTTCNIPQDGGRGDWRVSITNQSGRSWRDLFFVADSIYSVGNSDGVIDTFPDSDAFYIDKAAINNSLVENGIPQIPNSRNDGIFSPGETWDFLVTDFFLLPFIPAPAPSFGSLGLNSILTFSSTANIVARPVCEARPNNLGETSFDPDTDNNPGETCRVPEPSSTIALLVLGTLGAGSALLRKM